jgi:hypothetical protein
MLNKIIIFAPTPRDAEVLAATLNLRLRQWEWASEGGLGTWANVGDLLDSIEEGSE